MKTRTLALVLAIVPLGIGWYLGSATAVARAQAPQSPPTVAVPKAYGQFKAVFGDQQGAFIYEASDGTLRVMVGPTLLYTIRRN
jgi:predicted ATPase